MILAAASLTPEEKNCERSIDAKLLERIRDRALARLERLQRMRLGQPVLPPVRVELSK